MSTVAAMLIIGSSFAVAGLIIFRENRHCSMLKNADELMLQIKNRALYYSEPLTDILRSISDCDNKHIRSFCADFISESDLHSTGAPDVWCSTVDKIYGRYLVQYECDVLKHFGENICRSSKNEIINCYNKAYSDITEFIKTADDKRRTNTKSSAAISISLGIMLVVMLF